MGTTGWWCHSRTSPSSGGWAWGPCGRRGGACQWFYNSVSLQGSSNFVVFAWGGTNSSSSPAGVKGLQGGVENGRLSHFPSNVWPGELLHETRVSSHAESGSTGNVASLWDGGEAGHVPQGDGAHLVEGALSGSPRRGASTYGGSGGDPMVWTCPWNRRQRRGHRQGKGVVVHLFSGADPLVWTKENWGSYQCICVDTAMGSQFNIHHPGVWAYLWKLAEGGFIKAVIGGPPCRTTSRLRNRGPPGPRRLRGRMPDSANWANWVFHGVPRGSQGLLGGWGGSQDVSELLQLQGGPAVRREGGPDLLCLRPRSNRASQEEANWHCHQLAGDVPTGRS